MTVNQILEATEQLSYLQRELLLQVLYRRQIEASAGGGYSLLLVVCQPSTG